MGWWRAFHKRPWWYRWSVKLAVLGLTILLVAYPYPHRLATHLLRWRNPSVLIDPDAPALEPLVNEARSLLTADQPPQKQLRIIQRYVYEKLPYAWDWETWGVADYIPTVEEALAEGREDCDGRAVIAASILRALGHEAELVSDYTHVWVKTEVGETMSPGKRQSVIATDTGVQVRWRYLTDLVRASAYGWAVFPLYRELIVVAVFWILILWPGTAWRWRGLILLLLVDALLRLRVAGRYPWDAIVWLQALAVVEVGVALCLAHVAARRARSASSDAPDADTGVSPA
jgi:hypothetical protein